MPSASSPGRTDPEDFSTVVEFPGTGLSAGGGPGIVAADRHYGLDIETDTSIDGLDPFNSAIVAVAVSTVRSDHVLLGDEASILTRLDEQLARLAPGVIITWNGASFDLPFLARRAELLALPLSLRMWAGPDLTPAAGASASWPPPSGGFRASWGDHQHLDGYRLYCSDVRRTLGLSCGLKAMARLVGLQPVEVDRTMIHLLTDDQMTSYVASDARLARQLVARRMPAAAAFVDRGPLPVSPFVTQLPG